MTLKQWVIYVDRLLVIPPFMVHLWYSWPI